MWDNIGGKIKGLAKVIALLGIISSIIGGIVFINIAVKTRYGGGIYVGIGFATIFLGSLFSWIASWFMYGFGELIENSESIRYNTSKINETLISNSGDSWVCKKCSERNPNYSSSCKGCGAYK